MNAMNLELSFLAYRALSTTTDPKNAVKLDTSVSESSFSALNEYFPLQIADGTSDLSIALASNSTDYLILSTDQTISIKLNGSSTAMVLNPKAAGVLTPVLMQRGTITSLTVSNASGNSATLDIISVKV